jgi:RNA polymerase sigma-70 factor, ECF subfamily
MHSAGDLTDILAARAGDQTAFARLIEPYRQELLVHCYRMLGSIEDAEDTLQETFLRAWRRLGTFEGRASFRAWCYKIATHAAIDARDRRPRLMPMHTNSAADPSDPLPAPRGEPIWLEPLPDTMLSTVGAEPDAVYDARESVALAFLAALQHLPGRQRAVLILRDVLAWRAEEVAVLLDMTVAAANSALQRARTTMRALPGSYRVDTDTSSSDTQVNVLLSEYVRAWETADVDRLVGLLHDDAMLTMPPLPAWFEGRTAIGEFLFRHIFAADAAGRFRLLPTRANRCPAFAAYTQGPDGVYRPGALQVLTITGGRIAALHDFLVGDDRLFARFDLPSTLDR